MRFFRPLNLYIALVSILLAAIMLLPNVGPARAAKKRARMVTTTSSQARMTTPQAGVRLLEDILARMRNAPQIAMTNKQIQLESGAESAGLGDNNEKGQEDYRLAIKPRSKIGNSLQRRKQMPTLALLPQSGQYYRDQRRSGSAVRGGSGLLKSKAKARANKGFWEAEQAETAAPHQSIATYQAMRESKAESKHVWEKQDEADRLTAGLSQRSKDRIANSAGKLYEISRFFDNARQVQSMPAVKLKAKRPAEEAAADGPRVLEGASNQIASQYSGAMLDDRSAKKLPDKKESAQAPVHSSLLRSGEARLGSSFRSDSFGYGQYRGQGSGNKAVVRDYKLALLPPNVATGIPLVRLGSSSGDAAKALAAIGGASKSRIGKWAVWSYKRPGSRRIALQVFVRSERVEALRIFDSSLVGPSFGVRLGDSLSAVKKRFGEPAFILPEPVAGAGQNYVYPINQVSILMQRGGPKSAPAVASMLIFNVR